MKAQDILILAGVGLGAYILLTRNAGATAGLTQAQLAAMQAQQRNAASGNNAAQLVGAGINALSKLFGNTAGTVPLLGTYDGRAQTQWDVTPYGPSGPAYNNPSAYTAPVMSDGLAVNPVGGSSYEWANSMWGNG